MIWKHRFTYHYFKQKFLELLSYPENPRCLRQTLKFDILQTLEETNIVFLYKKKKAKLSFREMGSVNYNKILKLNLLICPD